MRDDYEWNGDLRGFGGGRWWERRSLNGFMTWVRETQSFNHLSDEVIFGWLRGRYEIKLMGMRKKSSAYYVDVTCSKCKGRGWFGQGRKDCPECIAVGKETRWHSRRWNGGAKFTGRDKRRLIWAENGLGFINDASIEMNYLEAFDRAANHREWYYPAWVDDVQITGKHTDKDKSKYLEKIKNQFSFEKIEPKVRTDCTDRRGEFSGYNIDPDEAINRLAMTFGCTCPITGEYIPPDQVSTIETSIHCFEVYDHQYNVLYEPHRLVDPFGFAGHVHIHRFQPCGNRTYLNCVSPFSWRGIKIIRKAATKCLKAMDGKIDNEWVLAEVMQSCILKRAA